MATSDSYRSICQRFQVGKATAISSVRRVTRAFCRVSQQFIKWPSGERANEVVRGFQFACTFPGVIGAVDGLHVNIPAPAENPEAYVNRKGHYSIQLQAVCDHKRLFTHIYVGQVGSVHDSRVFRLSELQTFMDQEDRFHNNSHIIGDAAHTLNRHLLVPYMDNGNLTDRQKNFNFCLSSARMTVERAFGLLRGRWRSLRRTLEMICTENVPDSDYVLACCVLHNICLLRGDEFEDFPVNVEQQGHVRGLPAACQPFRLAVGEAKKNEICMNLRMRDV
ncbi:Putative nuclease [Frankliniella fusca]|uniref:Putative nuclease HARBI1 n=1 Tax=Frankliniella fusca TaxID=407009 RepID=A0AAE1LH99_9NEOP|nr:Putative nuclease [Frankliniella fusca]